METIKKLSLIFIFLVSFVAEAADTLPKTELDPQKRITTELNQEVLGQTLVRCSFGLSTPDSVYGVSVEREENHFVFVHPAHASVYETNFRPKGFFQHGKAPLC